MVVELYTALKRAGVDEAEAQAAAVAVAERSTTHRLESVIDDIKRDLTDLKIRMAALEGRMVALEGNMQAMKWMLGFLMAGNVALLVRAFFPS